MANPLYDALFAPHRQNEHPFLLLPDGSSLSYRAFLDLAAQYAHTFAQAGLRPGDRLAVQIAKSAHALAVYAAALQTGVVFLPLNTAYTPGEVAYFIENARASVVLCDAGARDAIAPIAAANTAALMTLNADGSGSFAQAAATMPKDFKPVARGANDLAALLYTSGTTGRSKGAMLSQKNLLSNALTLVDEWQFSRDDILLHALPIFHTHGLFVATNTCLLAGAAMILLPAFSSDQVIAALPGATTMMGVPTFYTRLLDDPRFSGDLSRHMRLFISGSAPLLAETHSAFETRTGHRILERYGMTETNMNTSNPYKGARKPGTVGPALPGVALKITDAITGQSLPRGATGIIEVRGDNVFQGYWQMPEKTAEELRENGYFITGDLGHIDKHGYLTIVGRARDLIISGGYNIYPKEVELVLDDQPGVLESAVIGVPHHDFGEAVVGILVARPGAVPEPAAILSGIADQLAAFKRPKKLIVLDELPRNAMGKVQKNTLRASYRTLFSQPD